VEEQGQPLAGERARLPLYRVLQPSGVRSRLDVAGGRLTRFVGREVELATLVERWERARDGEGQNVLVLGEAGVGKSRLAYQLRERLASVPHTWLECGASAYTEGTPFHPLVSLVSQALAFDLQHTPEQKLARIEVGLGKLSTAENVALVADFLGLPPPTPIAFSADLQRRKTIDLLVQWALAQSEAQPQVLVVEDLHWCDASSLELLSRLVAQSATSRLLLVTTARPGFAAPWPAREHTTTLSLARLTKRQAREMVSALADRVLAADTLDALVARADGVPLFVEELTKSVLSPGAARGIEAIPATLADSLMARLDRLPAAKEVAQRAAVIGREFSYALLAKVSGSNEDALRESLARLCEEEILFVRGDPPDAAYVFKHALVQEAARESLLKRTRQQLHGRVVDVLLHAFPERAAAEPELVARHAEAAGRSDVAIVSHRRAGERAQAHSAHAEAIHHFELAIALLTAQPESAERDGREAPLQLALAESRSVAIGYTSPQVEAAHERARLLCEAVGDARGLGFALSGLAVFSYNSGRTEDAFRLATRELAIAEQSADAELVLRAHADLGLIQIYRGAFESALQHLEASIELAGRDVRHVEMSATGDPAVRALSASAWTLWALGWPDRALARAREGVERARALEHPFNLAHALLFETVTHALRRDFAMQQERAAEVVALSEANGFPFWVGVGRTFHAAARIARGELEAVQDARAGYALTASTGSRGGMPAALAQLAQAYLMAGRVDSARAAAVSGIALANETGQPVYDSILQLLKARVLLAGGSPAEEVEALLRRAIEIARGQGARSFELRAATQLAQCLRDRGKQSEAKQLLAPVYGWFREGHDTADLAAARELLDTLA
jgi:tetratricopeptide (TPR) repeat protein